MDYFNSIDFGIFLSDTDYGNHKSLYYISMIVGYLYTAAWGISFLGQIHLNYEKKNVQGCNLDFVVYNITGFFFYSIYNSVGYWYPEKSQIGQIQLNDLIFTYWSFIMCSLTCAQCIYYPKLNNKVSTTCKIATPIYFLFIIIYALLQFAFNVIPNNQYDNTWYMMSYIKLWISLTKYMPQVYWNYKRKSTEGWSIINIALDLTGGTLSLLQMFLDMINGTDSTFDPDSSQGLNVAKFGLSIIAIFFDIIFIVQHYILYPKKKQNNNQISEYIIGADSESQLRNDANQNLISSKSN
ncbi:hypothetical protein PPERSA_07843 [Pseudocohnilembus persalinus]|uniref:Lysosomal cystine transporter n=1 Tax=Pseudocohnilembus persalinus TaxID=266149 RepID=A0A0V0QBY5_PSEPJ|nr:hypothetical protein PPERSA_07843 [Pseudocohnilembus persalinus]|eukprot:KRW99766.1 hypothetical protein PPERSA_07843 [Pseudocohnilembus persalinus]